MRVLVIKLGALGDLVLAFQPFADIRAHHGRVDQGGAEITLLTTAGFAGFLEGSPWFDRVVVDERPAWWDVRGLRRLRGALLGFDFVYDLQTSSRSSQYFRLAGRPAWSGIARGARFPHANPLRDGMHTVERQREQLAMAGVPRRADAEVGWLCGTRLFPGVVRASPTPGPSLRERGEEKYGLLAPGGAAHRLAKRWGVEGFATVAGELVRRGVRPVVVGTAGEAALGRAIVAACPEAVDLTGRTTLRELAGLAAEAVVAVGNDTGPMHLAAAMGCRCVVLFSGESDPALTAPRGRVTVLREGRLADLEVARVAAALP